ncbi:hypothetical protein BH11ACT8_BH11ACT8_01800 [soil metagenome]
MRRAVLDSFRSGGATPGETLALGERSCKSLPARSQRTSTRPWAAAASANRRKLGNPSARTAKSVRAFFICAATPAAAVRAPRVSIAKTHSARSSNASGVERGWIGSSADPAPVSRGTRLSGLPIPSDCTTPPGCPGASNGPSVGCLEGLDMPWTSRVDLSRVCRLDYGRDDQRPSVRHVRLDDLPEEVRACLVPPSGGVLDLPCAEQTVAESHTFLRSTRLRISAKRIARERSTSSQARRAEHQQVPECSSSHP